MTKDSVALVRAWLDAFNDGERDRFRELLHPEAVFAQRALGREDIGAETITQSFWAWRSGFVGLHGEITDAFAARERAAAEVLWTGLHGEEHRAVRFVACFLFRVDGEQLCEIVNHYDLASFQRQLGV